MRRFKRVTSELRGPVKDLQSLNSRTTTLVEHHARFTLTQQDLDQVAMRLNERPGKMLGYKTPAAVLATIAAWIG